MGNMQAQQEQMQEKLKAIIITHEQNGIHVEMNALQEILNIEIDEQYLSVERKEELQDVMIVAINGALQKANDSQQSENATMLNDLLPGGLGGMFGA